MNNSAFVKTVWWNYFLWNFKILLNFRIMNQTIRAVYENGIFRPLQPLDLPEGSIVWIKITEILGDSTDFVKDIEKDLSELKRSEREHPEKEMDD